MAWSLKLELSCHIFSGNFFRASKKGIFSHWLCPYPLPFSGRVTQKRQLFCGFPYFPLFISYPFCLITYLYFFFFHLLYLIYLFLHPFLPLRISLFFLCPFLFIFPHLFFYKFITDSSLFPYRFSVNIFILQICQQNMSLQNSLSNSYKNTRVSQVHGSFTTRFIRIMVLLHKVHQNKLCMRRVKQGI